MKTNSVVNNIIVERAEILHGITFALSVLPGTEA